MKLVASFNNVISQFLARKRECRKVKFCQIVFAMLGPARIPSILKCFTLLIIRVVEIDIPELIVASLPEEWL